MLNNMKNYLVIFMVKHNHYFIIIMNKEKIIMKMLVIFKIIESWIVIMVNIKNLRIILKEGIMS